MLVQSLVKAVLQQLCSCKSFFVWVPTEEQQLRSRKAVREAEEGSREKATHLLPTTTENQRELSSCCLLLKPPVALHAVNAFCYYCTHIDYLMMSSITIFIYSRVDKDCLSIGRQRHLFSINAFPTLRDWQNLLQWDLFPMWQLLERNLLSSNRRQKNRLRLDHRKQYHPRRDNSPST